MRYSTLPLLMALALLGITPSASAQGPAPASCVLGTAQADLDINNVAGRVFNTGGLFYGNGAANFYYVPATSGRSPIYASGIWVGGKVGGELRVAGGTYGAGALEYNFWPGPLDSGTGQPVNPASCAAFDKIYSVTQTDIANLLGGGSPSPDLAAWPVELGAPYFVDIDGSGTRSTDGSEPRITRAPSDPGYGVNGTKIDLGAGQLPDIIGTQGLWWVMNDVGNVHPSQNTPPLGIEVQVLAFSFSRADALGNTTFYKYKIYNKSGTDITDAYVSVWSDPDLGDASDDFVASDVESGLGFVYNETSTDGTGDGTSYGFPAPAVGYDFFQGPIVADGPDEGSDLDTLSTSSFLYSVNGDDNLTDPSNGVEIYNLQQGLFKDGSVIRAFGNGYNQSQGEITKFSFPGDPVTGEAWSEVNPGPGQQPNQGGDRRFVISTGPFTLGDGDVQDIVFGIVFAQGDSNFGSITALRAADQLAQTAYDIDFALAPPPPAPPLCVEGSATLAPGSGRCFEAVEQDGQATLVWGYPTSSSNYLGRFEVFDALLRGQGAADSTYNFEGFNIYKYTSSSFETSTRTLVATYDKVNGITQVIDQQFDPTLGALRDFITARGTDSGLRYSYDIPNLTNYTDYFYGITAYAYNAESVPKINESAATLITVRPSRLTNDSETASQNGTPLTVSSVTQVGEGSIRARVVDPTSVTGHTYEVRFFKPTEEDGTVSGVTTYSIYDTTTNTVVLDGQAYYAQTGEAYPQGNNVTVIDGFTFDILGPEPGFKTFLTVANGAGPLDPPEYAAGTGPSFGDNGFPNLPEGLTVDPVSPTPAQQVGPARWFIMQGSIPTDRTYETFLERVTRAGANFPVIGGDNYEMRFTGSSLAYRAFSDGGSLTVPFELWDVRATNDDPSDDVRLIPYFLENDTPDVYDLGTVDHVISGANNDPFTDLIYWRAPVDMSPGQAGYDAYAGSGTPNTGAVGPEIFARLTLVNWNGGNVPGPYNQALPETGTIFRIVTTKPNQPGDTFSINTAGTEMTTPTEEDIQRSLDRIAAVPNPYFGSSSYESGNLSSVIRFTNLPEQPARIRIFTVSGSLVTTLNKTSSSRSLDWNLLTSNNLPVASGMYLVHVDIDGVGERTLKLGIVNRRTRVTVF